LALAVGLTRKLAAGHYHVNLAHAQNAMARKKVIVKRLASIENFGSMNAPALTRPHSAPKGMYIPLYS